MGLTACTLRDPVDVPLEARSKLNGLENELNSRVGKMRFKTDLKNVRTFSSKTIKFVVWEQNSELTI